MTTTIDRSPPPPARLSSVDSSSIVVDCTDSSRLNLFRRQKDPQHLERRLDDEIERSIASDAAHANDFQRGRAQRKEQGVRVVDAPVSTSSHTLFGGM